jgi:hypothetical protein
MIVLATHGWLVMVFLLGACWGDDTYLSALVADPMAEYESDGIVMIDSWEQSEGRSLVGDKPVHAEVGRTYRIVDQDEAHLVFDAAVSRAVSQGWKFAVSEATGALGAKELASRSGRLSIALIPDDPLNDPDGPLVLRIYIDFGVVGSQVTTSTES